MGHEAAKQKFIMLYEAAKKCLLIIDQLYTDFEKGILCKSTLEYKKLDESNIIRLYISAFGLIDFCNRFHNIINALPLLRKDKQELKRLDDLLSPITDCRNYLQHMTNDLLKEAEITFSILGSISWIENGCNFTLISNQATQKQHASSIPFDRVEGKYVCKYQLVIGTNVIQLDTVYNGVRSFWRWLESVSIINPTEIKIYKWGQPLIIHSSFEHNQNNFPK